MGLINLVWKFMVVNHVGRYGLVGCSQLQLYLSHFFSLKRCKGSHHPFNGCLSVIKWSYSSHTLVVHAHADNTQHELVIQ